MFSNRMMLAWNLMIGMYNLMMKILILRLPSAASII